MNHMPDQYKIEHRPAKTNHPLSFISHFCEDHPEIRNLEFGIYKYRPQRVEDERIYLKVKPSEVEENYQTFQARLEKGTEIALHSRVLVATGKSAKLEVRHIPMIDFTGNLSPEDLNRLGEVALDFHCNSMAVFNSGRSFHFYGFALLTSEQWLKFMGRVLLLNLPGEPDIVDCRWVGHRLIAGYSSLRWSKNSRHYKKVPEVNYRRGNEDDEWTTVQTTLTRKRAHSASKELVEA